MLPAPRPKYIPCPLLLYINEIYIKLPIKSILIQYDVMQVAKYMETVQLNPPDLIFAGNFAKKYT